LKHPYTDLISVIIPVYNSADTLRRCIDSVLAQTYKNLEIIIVYKESDDESWNILKSIKDSRIKIIKQIDNLGPGRARNMGMDCATGTWIGFVEADDTIDADFYEKLFNAANVNNCDIALGQIKQGNWLKKSAIYSTYHDKLSILKNGAAFDKLFKSQLIKTYHIRFMEGVRWEDNLFIFRALYYGKLITVPDTYYSYETFGWTPEYANKLKQDVLPACDAVWTFIKSAQMTTRTKNLAKRKIVESIAKPFITDKYIYRGLMKMFGNPLFLWVMHYKKILKQKKDKK